MENLRTTPTLPLRQVLRRLWAWRRVRQVVLFVALGAVLISGFYLEEYWRGKRAWEQCRVELAAKGAALTWEALSSPPVADDDNFFAAPRMKEWFGSIGPNELSTKLSLPELVQAAKRQTESVLAHIAVVSLGTDVAEGDADAVLLYRDSSLTLSTVGPPPSEESEQASAIIPLIVMDDVPLASAIKNLARQAGINYILDPRTELSGQTPQPSVTVRWENVTARQALGALLNNYCLERVSHPHGVATIQPKDPSGPKVLVDATALERLHLLLRTALEEKGSSRPSRGLVGSQGLWLLERPVMLSKPLRLVVRTDEMITEKELAQFMPSGAFGGITGTKGCFQVRPAAFGSYRVTLGPETCCAAANYLAWSDRCQPEFDRIRAALRRPGVRLSGACEATGLAPERNFVGMRLVAQTLTQRAQCYLLLNEPEAALRELTLVHALSRVLTCKPVTLVAGMLNVAVAGIYAQVVKDGLQMNVWQEKQLRVLDSQLRELNLVLPVVQAFQGERLMVLHVLDRGNLAELYRQSEELRIASPQPGYPQQFRRAGYGLLPLIPRGWVYQNMATLASLHQDFIDAADANVGVIDVLRTEAAERRAQEVARRHRPETFLAAAAFPTFTRAWQTTAQNQALVTELRARCAQQRTDPQGTLAADR